MSSNKESKSTINLPDDNDISFDITQAFEDPNALNIGKTFVEARAKKGLTQEQASRKLKVRIKLIVDFEEGKSLELPGLAYKIGFVRSYASLVELDTDYIVESYKQSIGAEEKRVSYNFLEAKKEKKSFIPLASLATFLICLISYSSWYYNNLNSIPKNDKQQVSESVIKQNMPKLLDYVKVEEQDLLVANEKQISNNSSTGSINKDDLSNVDLLKNEKNIVLDNGLTSKLEDEQIIKNLGQELKNPNETSAIANERNPGTEMVLKSVGNSWVEIEDLDGNSLVTRLMRNGETYVIPKKKGLTLSTGNAGVLSLTYGDVYISSLGNVGEVISSRPLNIEAFRKR